MTATRDAVVMLVQTLPPPQADPALLIVDDEPEIRATLVAAFRRVLPHVSVVTAKDGEEALARMAAQRFDLVLSDHCMPGMLGIDLLARVKEADPECSRVLMTAHPEMSLAMRGINDRVLDRFLTKPFRSLEAAALVKTLLDERRERILKERAFSRSYDLMQRRIHPERAP